MYTSISAQPHGLSLPDHAITAEKLFPLSLWPLRLAVLEWRRLAGYPGCRVADPWGEFTGNLGEMVETWLSMSYGPVDEGIWLPGAHILKIGHGDWHVQATAVIDPEHISFSSSKRRCMLLAGDAILWTPALAWVLHLSILRIGRASFVWRGRLGAALANVGRIISRERFAISREILAKSRESAKS